MRRSLLLSTFTLAMIACSSARAPVATPPPPTRAAPIFWPSVLPLDAVERTSPPSGNAYLPFAAPKIDVVTLPNGFRCFLVERHDLPMVFVRLIVKRGSSDAPPGVAQMTGRMLFSGTSLRTAAEVHDAFRRGGMDPTMHHARELSWMDAQVLSAWFREGIGLLADVFQNSTFAPDELEVSRTTALARIARRNDDPYALLAREIDEALYPPGHPYHEPLSPTRDDVTRITREQVVSFFRSEIRPDTVSVIVAGDVRRGPLEMALQSVFGSWRRLGGARSPAPPLPIAPPPPNVILIDQPGMMQATLTLAKVGVSSENRDLAALSVMNEILGAAGTGRLYENLRRVHGTTYWISSKFELGRGARPFTISTSVSLDRVVPIVQGILAEVRRLGTELVEPDELARAKDAGRRRLPARFATLGGIASAISDLVAYDRPLDDYDVAPARIDAVTAEDVRRVAAAYVQPEALRLFLVADAEKLRPEIARLELGSIEVKKGPRVVTKAAETDFAGKEGQ
jgi:zinc protease